VTSDAASTTIARNFRRRDFPDQARPHILMHDSTAGEGSSKLLYRRIRYWQRCREFWPLCPAEQCLQVNFRLRITRSEPFMPPP